MMLNYHIDHAIADLRRTDETGAACLALRHRGICPICRDSAPWSPEDAVRGTRSCSCIGCGWTLTVPEGAYRGDPTVTLRMDVERAISIAKARERQRERQKAISTQERPTRPREYTIPWERRRERGS